MRPREVREVMWAQVMALYAAYWPGRATITGPTILAMEDAGLSKHDGDAVLVAVRIAGRTSEHPPSVAELLKHLEGETRRVPLYRKDVYNRVVIGSDNTPVVTAWRTEKAEPAAYVELRRKKGLPEPPRPDQAYRPPELDRPEHDGEPRPALPAELIERVAPEAISGDQRQGAFTRVRTPNPAPARSDDTWMAGDGCWACGHKRNKLGATLCEHCKRPLDRGEPSREGGGK